MNHKTADLLIDAYTKATSRTRGIFVILQMVTIIFVIGYFNHRFSWLRRNIDAYKIENGNRPEQDLTTVKDNIDFYYKVYAYSKELRGDMKFIDFDLVGVKIYIEDLPFLGSIALTILMTWFFYVNRRESGIIKEIAQKVSKETDPNMIEYMFYGTSFNLVFNTIKTIDNEEISFSQLMSIYIRRILLFLPSIMLLVILSHDMVETFFIETPYQGKTVWEYFADNLGARTEILLRIFVPIPLLIYCLMQSSALKAFAKKDAENWKTIQDSFMKTRENK